MTDFKPNCEQQKAIDAINGSVMLLAGPGTGKTFTLIKRIEKMLSCGILPESILCLTFSEAASNEMKTRLVEKIGMKGAGVNIYTYHSFCMDIIRQNPMEFEMAENVQMADDVTKQAILKDTIDEFGGIEFLKDKWGNKYFYISKIISGIETIKRERITKEEFFKELENNWEAEFTSKKLELQERIKNGKPTKDFLNKMALLEKKIGKAREFWKIYEIYKRKLDENNLIDYSDMINLVLCRMESDIDFLYNISKGYKYVLVDEYQDTSKVQNDLIFNILRGMKNENIFVVGDDDQIIYSFQGARSSNLSDFLDKFPNAKVICLEENRRSTQTILDFAVNLIEDDSFRLTNNPKFKAEKKLIAKNPIILEHEQKINFNIFSETIQENNNIVEEIQTLKNNGIKLSEIAVLASRNDALENFARLLKQKGIPFFISAKKNALESPSFIQTYFYLKILANSYLEQDKLFGLISFAPFKVEDKTIAGILGELRKSGKNLYETMLNSNLPEIKIFMNCLNELRSKKSYTMLVPFIYEVITKSGILEYYSNNENERFENISALNRLIDEARSYALLHKGARLNDFVKHLDTYYVKDIKMELKNNELKTEAVRLLTYHGSKGREFEHVFMPNLTSKAFEKAPSGNRELALPVKKSKFTEDKDLNLDAELKRLLFVGITRAKYGLHLSYSNTFNGVSQSATKYISNLFPKAGELIENKFFQIDENAKIDETIKDLKVSEFSNDYKKELQIRVENLVISQTSLNKYINCPLQYLYSDILKVPVFIEDKDILSYGSSIHGAIEFMTNNAIKVGIWGSQDEMFENFCKETNKFEFSSPEKRADLISRGKNSIEKNFYAFTQFSPSNIISAECRMELEFEGCILKGFADRISKDSEGKIHIYDFKTGSYKKIKQNENYYNQLCFYKFLYETLHPNEKIGSCALVFFEEGCKISSPDEIEIDNEKIKEKIHNAITGIKSLDFEPKYSEDNCNFCEYKLICKLFKNNAKPAPAQRGQMTPARGGTTA